MDASVYPNGGSVDQLTVAARAIEIEAEAQGFGGSPTESGLKAPEDWQEWLPTIAPKTFTAPFEWFHSDFLDWYWELLQIRAKGQPVPEDKPLAGLLVLGRGLGKSTILESIALAEGAHMGRSFGVYISSTEQKAGEHLQSIRDLIESSEVARYYPGLAKPRLGKFGNQRGWRAEAVYTEGGFGIVAASLERGIRGLRDSEIRPTFILLDDIDERDDSVVTKQEKFDSIRFDALPMLAPFGLAIFAQNLIYAGSIAEDTVNRKLDWFHHRYQVGPVNTFQDDLAIEKVGGRPMIVSGTANWSRIGRAEGQALLNLIGEEAIYRECQNRTAPPAEKLVWNGFSESIHVITWEQFASVFNSRKIPSDWFLYGGYDAGTTGPERHPAVFSVAAVAAENSKLPGDVFLFYEYVAEAGEGEDDMAKGLLTDLATLCHGEGVKEAAALVTASYGDVSERQAWTMRQRAGQLIKFRLFHGSHEANSERKTFRSRWGLPMVAGKSGKTEGLSQLRFYLKPERQLHPFKPGVIGRPNLYLVVADDQARVARDRFGLSRHRWEAANLKWDANITTRDVPTKFGDDATDAVKQYLQTFALVGKPLTDDERDNAQLPVDLRSQNKPDAAEGSWVLDSWRMRRDYELAKIRKKHAEGNKDPNDPWSQWSPAGSAIDDPWAKWSPNE